MKVDVTRDVETNIHGAVDFKVSENAYKIFSMLSNFLYSDKEFAVLYELSANAHDEHAVAGKSDVPFSVTLPTRLESKLRIRDYGRGLSEPDVTRLLGTYGESTKTGSNVSIGGWGIGFKSVASVSSTWNVVSHNDGTRKDYLIFINETGIPALTKIKESETDETGIEIIIPIPHEKISTWENLMSKVFKHFPVKPNFVNKKIEFREDKPVNKGSCWSLLYKVDYDYYATYKSHYVCSHREYTAEGSKLDPAYSFLLNLPLQITFDIGELELSISRETIQYTKHTVDAINAKLKLIYDELVKQVTDGLSGASDELAYREAVFKLMPTIFGVSNANNSHINRIIKEAIAGKYGILNIPEDINNVTIPLSGKFFAFNGNTLTEPKSGWNCWKTNYASLQYDHKNKTTSLKVKVSTLSRIEFYHKDVYDSGSRIRGNHKAGHYMFLFEQNTFPDIFKSKVNKASTLTKLPRVVNKKVASVGDFYAYWRNSFQKVQLDLVNKKYTYIYTGNFRDHSQLARIDSSKIKFLQDEGYIILAVKRGFGQQSEKRLPKTVLSVVDTLNLLLEGLKNDPNLLKEGPIFEARKMFYSVYSNPSDFNALWTKMADVSTAHPSKWNEIKDKVKDSLEAGRVQGFSYYHLTAPLTVKYNKLAGLLGQSDVVHKYELDQPALMTELLDTYPLLKYVTSNVSWEDQDLKTYLGLVGK